MTRHEDAQLLLPAYTFGVASDEERRAVELHVAVCEACRQELQQFEGVSSDLAFAAGAEEPPAGLRQQILDAIPSNVSSAAPQESEGRSRAADLQGRRRRRGAATAWLRPGTARWAMPALAAACIGLVFASGMLAQQVSSLEQDLSEQKRIAALADERGDAAGAGTALVSDRVIPLDTSGELSKAGVQIAVTDERSGAAVLLLQDVPDPPAGKSWQVWKLQGDRPYSVGTVERGANIIVMPAERVRKGKPISGYAITLEPAGGSAQPTSDPLGLASV